MQLPIARIRQYAGTDKKGTNVLGLIEASEKLGFEAKGVRGETCQGKSISDVLNMTIDQATDFFELIPKIHRKLKTIKDVGLGYITLGQQSTTISGNEVLATGTPEKVAKHKTSYTAKFLKRKLTA
ncbi:hypothetical protein G1K66_01870 [Tenacibaculum finnmarkense]|uniref:cysteine peptidase family C39 domain-containing protein n=1 Tax=Tenacibaculum finnmarkense TaxID=2781243 RepID=UPI001E456325|nr:hypothetical protein [Tenacibaculum finnmarkense]MCG8812003.1 hypothetical protein [Tenacibaculum finnmarkense]